MEHKIYMYFSLLKAMYSKTSTNGHLSHTAISIQKISFFPPLHLTVLSLSWPVASTLLQILTIFWETGNKNWEPTSDKFWLSNKVLGKRGKFEDFCEVEEASWRILVNGGGRLQDIGEWGRQVAGFWLMGGGRLQNIDG